MILPPHLTHPALHPASDPFDPSDWSDGTTENR